MRLLDSSEHHRLSGIEWYGKDRPLPHSGASKVVVAERGQEIVGFWLAQAHVHADPVWVREDHRGGSVGVRMMRLMAKALKDDGVEGAYISTDIPKVGEYLGRLGLKKLDAQFYFWEV